MKESKKEAIKKEVIYWAEAISDSIKIRHAFDNFDEYLPDLIERTIKKNEIDSPVDREELLEYLQPTINDLFQKHRS